MSLLRTSAVLAVMLFAAPGCGTSGGTDAVDSTLIKIDGSPSSEFEQDDLDRAANASDAVKAYCAGAASEAQRLGCESHVTDSQLP